MTHFGIISPPVSGHLNPFGALGRGLIKRGHRVTLFHMPDLESKAREEGLKFHMIGEQDHPKGSLPESLAQLSQLKGLAALRFTIRAIQRTTEMICRDGPDAIKADHVDMLLVDQTEPAGASVAERLGLPFITVCQALAMNREPDVPPPFTAWGYREALWARARNRLGYFVSDQITQSIFRTLARYREKWNLAPYRTPEDSFSSLAQISQQVPTFDFPRRHLPACFHYVGPLRYPPLHEISFPWERLDGRPLIYASLGTLQNRSADIFNCMAEACRELPVQLVISHGGGLNKEATSNLPGSPLVVNYAPQVKVLSKARLTLTHAGLNTVLDSLSQGVPIVAIPLTYEQPAIAARLEWVGAGESIAHTRLSVMSLRQTIRRVLASESAHLRAQTIQESIRQAGGVEKAIDIMERLIYK